MNKQITRNPIDAAFSRGDVPRHQVHQDRRKTRRVKHRSREHVEWDSD